MKKIFIAIFLFLPLMSMQAQSVLTPQQQLEEAQRKLEEAKKAVEVAKQKAKEEAEKKAAAQKEAAKIQEQIKAAEAETERLKAEAARINAETESGKSEAAVSSSNTEAVSTENKASVSTSAEKAGWVIPTQQKVDKEKIAKEQKAAQIQSENAQYLEGAVTLDENGKVVFVAETDANGKNADQIYDIVYNYLAALSQDKQSIGNRIALVNKDEHVIACAMDEWLQFSSSFISLDRTECKYTLLANISDNKLKLTLYRISFIYEEGRSTGFKSPAEEVITDNVALNKKKTKLAKIFGKFRRKTIDRKNQLFNEITTLVKQ